MKRNGLIVAVVVALVLSLAAGAFASQVVATKAKVVPRPMSLAIDKTEVDFGDVERGQKNVISEDVVTATVSSPDLSYSLTVEATALGDIPANKIECKVDDGVYGPPGETTGDPTSTDEKEYAFVFQITEVPETAELGEKTGTITFDLSTVSP